MNSNKLKVCYSSGNNVGDAINSYIFERILCEEILQVKEFDADFTGIGSGLRHFFVDFSKKGIRYRVKALYKKMIDKSPIVIWSAGFITTPTGREKPIRNMEVVSVRGKLSKMWVERLLNREVSCTVGDAGLLSSLLVGNVEKRYSLGIIPHRREKDEPFYEELNKSIDNSVIIDVEGSDPIETIRMIASCDCIISSSLHGLIIADSFCIPNKHIILTDKLSGDGFKFRDYYSSYDIEDNFQDLRKNSNIDINAIKNEYSINKEQIEEKQYEIEVAFRKGLKYLVR